MHHLDEGSLSLKKVELLVIDEVDKIFELNFEEQIKVILKNCPPSKQVLMFSATIPLQLSNFMKVGMREYKLIDIPEESKIPEKLKINLIYSRTEDKKYALISLLKNQSKRVIDIYNEQTLIFVATKYHCEYLHEFLKLWNIKTLYIYGQMDQELRNQNLLKFRKKNVNTLIVTDVAARGLDIPMLDNVINYEFPDSSKLFIHRIGRTARVGKEGRVFNLASPNDLAYFFDIKVILGKKLIVNKENSKDIKDEIKDCSVISFGTVPEAVISSVKECRLDYLNSKTDLESLEDSCNKASTKALLFKQKPSKFGIKQAKKFINLESIQYFPLFNKIMSDDKFADEKEKNKFLTQLKNFKPKESYFERVNEVNVKEEVVKEFKVKADEYKKKKENEKKKEKMLSFTEKFKEDMDDFDDQKEQGNGFVDYESNENIKKNSLLGKKVKRSKLKNFKKNNQFISETKQTNSKSLWGDEKPLSLDELTLNFVPDDGNTNSTKKTVWDPKKKNFVRGKVDKSGKLIKTNEAGVKIKSNDKNPKAYQTWKKKNKLRVQNVGEMENEKIINNADNMFRERKMNKRMKTSGPKKGKNELKSFDQIFKDKKDKFKKQSRKNFSKKDAKVRQINEKSHLNRKSFAMVKKFRKRK
jgi:ATP-dependent RNA helicase DDX54/DBP10